MSSDFSRQEIFKFLADSFDTADNNNIVDNLNDMINKKILAAHPYPISQYSDGRWKTYVPDPTKKSGRRQIAKSTRAAVEQEIIKLARVQAKLNTLTLEKCYKDWLLWRRDSGIEAKTITENKNDWNRFLSNHSLAKKPLNTIKVKNLDDFFMTITRDHIITYRCLSNVRGLLNGIFKFAIREELINENPLDKIDLISYKKRCKPVQPKENYTIEERQKLLEYLSNKHDVYSLAIQLAFYLCVRIGELSAIKKSDIKNGVIYIQRSQRKKQVLNNDLTLGPVRHEVENRIKGNLSSGFRYIPLTPKAQQIVSKILMLYPEGEYLFERNGNPILGDTFNEHLKAACEAVGIPYRSSHQIRFTMATLLASEGVPVTEISTMLGHSDTATTYHYIRQQQVRPETAQQMQNILDK